MTCMSKSNLGVEVTQLRLGFYVIINMAGSLFYLCEYSIQKFTTEIHFAVMNRDQGLLLVTGKLFRGNKPSAHMCLGTSDCLSFGSFANSGCQPFSHCIIFWV